MAKQHVDGDDYTYTLTPAKEPLRQFDVTPWTEKQQAVIDDLRKRVAHLELCVHRLMNQEGEL